MTYCVAVRLEAGMIFASDSRTNAGVDQVATFSKMRVYEKPDDRVIVGGQIGSEPPRLFHVYSEGNFIEATEETPYFQLGESKYGKPILDRVELPDPDWLD